MGGGLCGAALRVGLLGVVRWGAEDCAVCIGIGEAGVGGEEVGCSVCGVVGGKDGAVLCALRCVVSCALCCVVSCSLNVSPRGGYPCA